jgi:hypothetical protein
MTIAKIGGAAGFAALSALYGLHCSLEAERVRSPRGAKRARNEEGLSRFMASLRANSSIPPVIFFAEYIDSWSMGDVFDRCFPRRRIPNIVRLSRDELELVGYRLPDAGALQRNASRILRTKAVREPAGQEKRWFLSTLLHAVDAWDDLVPDGALVVFREILGGLLEDTEIAKASETVPQWITACSRAQA